MSFFGPTDLHGPIPTTWSPWRTGFQQRTKELMIVKIDSVPALIPIVLRTGTPQAGPSLNVMTPNKRS